MRDLFNDFFGFPNFEESVRADTELFPKVLQKRTDEGYEITVEVPGCKQKDVSVEILGEGFLCIEAKRRSKKFKKTFSISSYLDADNAEAVVEDGLLTVTIPTKNKNRKLL